MKSRTTPIAMLAPFTLVAALAQPPPARSPETAPPASGPLVPGMHGVGCGRWRGPEDSFGRLRTALSERTTDERFAVDAWIARVVPIGSGGSGDLGGSRQPHDLAMGGSLYGSLLALDPLAGPVAVATVLGQWEQAPDGAGRFLAQILVPVADSNGAPVRVGVLRGSFHAPLPGSGKPPLGELVARWTIDG